MRTEAGRKPLRRGAVFFAICAILAAFLIFLTRHRLRWQERLSPLWVSKSANIRYGPYPENRVDILRSRWGNKSGKLPAVLVFHGGGWVTGTKEEMLTGTCHRYLKQGFLVANVEYRLGAIAPAVEDARMALHWFLDHVSDYGGDLTRVVVTGESAGGLLALMSAFEPGVHVAAVVNIYGVSDLSRMLDRPAISSVLDAGNRELAAKNLSPVTHVRAGLPPVFSIHGTADSLVPPEQTRQLTQALKLAGGEAYESYLEGAQHGFSLNEQQRAYAAIFAFLRTHGILSD